MFADVFPQELAFERQSQYNGIKYNITTKGQ